MEGDLDLCRELSKATALSSLHRLARDLEVRICELERAEAEEVLAHLEDEEIVRLLVDHVRALPAELQSHVREAVCEAAALVQ